MTDGAAFVKFDKVLFDALMQAPMGVVQLLVCLAVVRWTTGHYNQSHRPLSWTYLAEVTGKPRTSVGRALGDLIREGVIEVVEDSVGTKARSIRLNHDWTQWGSFTPTTRSDGFTRKKQSHHVTTSSAYRSHHVTTKQSHHVTQRRTTEEQTEEPSGADFAAPRNGKGKNQSSAQDLVAHAVTYAAELGRTLADSRKARIGKKAQELLQAGADPEQVKQAVQVVIQQNKSPSDMEYVLGDIQGGCDERNRRTKNSARKDPNEGRSINGEW